MGGALWTGSSTGLEDCAAKCHANAECNFYSWWGSSNWCEINEVCDHWGSDGSHNIYSYSIAGYEAPSGPTLLKSGTEALCYPTATAAKHEGCLWTGYSTGLEDCGAKCEANAECKFYSWWKSSNWCEINAVCDHWGSDGSHNIFTYGL